MHVEAVGATGHASDLKIGQFFFFRGEEHTALGLLTEDQGQKATVVFSIKWRSGVPWIRTGGLPHTVLIARELELRTDPSSLTFDTVPHPGNVISAGGRFFLVVGFRQTEFVTVNLQNGSTEDLPHTGLFVSFSRWSIGLSEAARWIPIFDFAATSQASDAGANR